MDLGVEVMENSELDLFQLYQDAAGKKKKIGAIEQDMKRQLGPGATYPDLLPRLAQFEVALLEFMEQNLGASQFGVFADKCWPAFERSFGFVPCYVNGRLAGRGIPVACEVDLYGALSEYLVQLAGFSPATLLDLNNSVPDDIIPAQADLKGASFSDLFMGFHCGNTAASCMKNCRMNYQVIMNRMMEGGKTPDITRGTLEGQLKPGPITIFRLQATPDCHLQSYIAEGEILDLDPFTFGGTGIIAIPNFSRFYRQVLVGKHFPHHTALGFSRTGKILFEAMKLIGIADLSAPLPETRLYPDENPF
jgi:L-fucose isomerase-like protein